VNSGERERLEAACAGDRRAFDVLCQTYRQEIYALCYRFLNRREDAEDVVQEVFSRAWQHLATYRREASFRTWLWEIGRNLCLNQLRARKSRLNQQTSSMEAMPQNERERALDVPDTRPTPEETTLDAAHLDTIRREIARCAAEKKWDSTDWELFLLRMEKSIPYAEFAQRQGRDEAYWRNRWRDKIKPVLERVRENILRENMVKDLS
jgi:RNA polymerase sigma-70 factor, ECF subfamily